MMLSANTFNNIRPRFDLYNKAYIKMTKTQMLSPTFIHLLVANIAHAHLHINSEKKGPIK